MKRLTVTNFGTDTQGIRLHGDPQRQPEPTYVRIAFPTGDVDVVRTQNGDYWVHVRVNKLNDCLADGDAEQGRIVAARLDIEGKSASEANVGDFNDPDLYHLAVRVTAKADNPEDRCACGHNYASHDPDLEPDPESPEDCDVEGRCAECDDAHEQAHESGSATLVFREWCAECQAEKAMNTP